MTNPNRIPFDSQIVATPSDCRESTMPDHEHTTNIANETASRVSAARDHVRPDQASRDHSSLNQEA